MSENEQIEKADLSFQQIRAIELLITGRSISAIAKELGIARNTLYAWLNDDHHFQNALNAQRKRLQAEVEDRLNALSEKAFEVFEKALEDQEEKNLRLRAAEIILKGLGFLSGKKREYHLLDKFEIYLRDRLKRGEITEEQAKKEREDRFFHLEM